MAKIFIQSLDGLDTLASTLENFLKKNSGHRKALFQNQADFTLEICRDTSLGSKVPTVAIFDDNEALNAIGTAISNGFRSILIEAGYPKKVNESREFLTLVIKVGRPNDPIDEVQYGNIIGEAIVKYYNPEYELILKNQSEPTIKASKDKTYYDRAFNQNSTSNASLIFKKKS
jgi:hypothetical protein